MNQRVKILVVGEDNSEVLEQIADAVNKSELDSIQPLIEEMQNILEKVGGEGLAAPQIGVSKRIIVLNGGKVLINPTYLARSGKITSRGEGCLSIPGKRFDVKRNRMVKIKYWNRYGEEKILRAATKMMAIVVQHEIDHLDGILICDKGAKK